MALVVRRVGEGTSIGVSVLLVPLLFKVELVTTFVVLVVVIVGCVCCVGFVGWVVAFAQDGF